MIETFGIPRQSDGKKTRIRCAHCPKLMRAEPQKANGVLRYSWEVDRFPICGHAAGKYVRGNIAPACPDCNRKRCTTAKKCRFGALDAVGVPQRLRALMRGLVPYQPQPQQEAA